MKNPAKKAKPGWPAIYENPRTSIAARLQAPLHERIKRDAEASGRSISEEIERRLERSFEWDEAHGSAQELLQKARDVTASNLVSKLRDASYQLIRTPKGKLWAEPGMDIGHLDFVLPPAVEDAIEAAVIRAMTKARDR
jgi:hypothetical protein